MPAPLPLSKLLASLASASPAETTTIRSRCTQWQEKLLSAYKTVDSDSTGSDLGVALSLSHCLLPCSSAALVPLPLPLALSLATLAASAYVVNVVVPLKF